MTKQSFFVVGIIDCRAPLRLLQNTSKLSFCGLTAESIKILSSIIDPALSRRMTEMEFRNSLPFGRSQ